MESFAVQAWFANLVAFSLAVIFSFFGHSKYTFRIRRTPDAATQSGDSHTRYGAFAKFSLTAILGLMLNTAIAFVIVDYLGYPYFWALPLVLVLVPVITFLISRNWAFRASL